MFELNPVKLLRSGVDESRLLRVLFVVACLGWTLLAVTFVTKPLDPTVALILFGFHIGTWYFALATRSALYFVMGLRTDESKANIAHYVDCACYGIVLFCQILFLITIFRVMEQS